MQIVKEAYQTYYDECVHAHETTPKGIAWETVKRKVEEQVVIQSPKKKEIALSDTERKSMEETALVEKSVSPLLRVLATCTGLRIGELTALTWNDVDWENEILIISKTVCKYYKRDKHGRRIKQVYDVGTPKTAHSNREVPLTERTMSVLKYLKELHQRNGWYKPNGLLYHDGHHYVARPTKLTRDLKKFCERTGVEPDRVIPIC